MRKAIIAASTVGLAAAYALSIPSHPERIAYLERALDDRMLTMGYNPFFDKAGMTSAGYQGREAGAPARNTLIVMLSRTQKEPFEFDLVSIRDYAFMGEEGDVDQLYLARLRGKDQDDRCELWLEDLPEDLAKRVNVHYDVSTLAGYLALTRGTGAYGSSIGEREYGQLWELCD